MLTDTAFLESMRQCLAAERGTIVERLSPKALTCNAALGQASVAFFITPALLNPFGTLHGGLSLTCMETAMRMTACAVLEERALTLASLDIGYLRPVPPDMHLTVRARVLSKGHATAHLTAEGYLDDADTPCLRASAVFLRPEREG